MDTHRMFCKRHPTSIGIWWPSEARFVHFLGKTRPYRCTECHSVPWSRENRGPPIVLDLESKSPLYVKMPSLEMAAKRPKGCSSRRVFFEKGCLLLKATTQGGGGSVGTPLEDHSRPDVRE